MAPNRRFPSPPPYHENSKYLPSNSLWTLEMQDIALLVHCRTKADICKQRVPFFEGYRRFFRTVIWMLADPAATWGTKCNGNGDPYTCVARILQRDQSSLVWTGVFYVHFDAVISPCALAQGGFDFKKIGVHARVLETVTISWLNWCNWRSRAINLTYGGRPVANDTGCLWWHWGAATGVNWLKAIANVRKSFPNITWNDTTVWRGFDDLFYIPRVGFSIFTALGDIFAKENGLPHEAVGPTIVHLSEQVADVKLQDLGCIGGCCSTILASTLMRRDFRCGHKVDWTVPDTDLRFAQLLGSCMPKSASTNHSAATSKYICLLKKSGARREPTCVQTRGGGLDADGFLSKEACEADCKL